MKPTEAQKRELLEWCGFTLRCSPEKDQYKRGIWNYPDGLIGDVELDLNNLFKYAVPVIFNRAYRLKMNSVCETSFHFVISKLDESEYHIGDDVDPALALFWAIWGVSHED